MTRKPANSPAPENVLPEDLPKADMTENARIIMGKRYLKKNEDGQPIEEPEQMFWRVARVIADVDAEYGASEGAVDALAHEFYRLMTQRLFEPNSPTLMNAGRPLGQLSACFVLPVSDALSNGKDGIYDTLRAMALVHQSGGGTGFSFSRLRPANDVVKSTMGVASGPVSFMKLYDGSTEVVKQGGTRRGANMGILRVDHPDIRDFITCKSDVSQVTNFNISVAITRSFMEALKKGETYELKSPRTGEVVGTEDANEIFDMIIHGAWATGEPGVFFIDEANKYNPVPELGEYEATNPCGEQPLLPYDVCNLGSINVGMFVKEDVAADAPLDEKIDWEEFGRVVHLAVHFLDNVIDANNYPLDEIHELAQKIRRIGLGVMGWADLLIRLGIPYNSDEAIEAADTVMGFIAEESRKASEKLAEDRGTFPAWEKSIWGPDKTAAKVDGERVRPMRKLRNSNITTVAPTGTISIFADCSGGIEPLFAVAFMRNQAGSLMADVNKDFIKLAKEQGWHSDELMERIAEEGHIHFDEVPEDVQRVFVTSHDVAPEWHIKMQAAFQNHVDSAISKTCNFSQEATEDDVREIYIQAYELDCKGVTVYRDGSRPAQVLSTGKTAKGETSPRTADLEAKLADAREENHQLRQEMDALTDALQELEVKNQKRLHKRTRPVKLNGTTRKIRSPLGDLYVTVNEDEDGKPFEVFATLGKAGGAAMAHAEAIGRLVSLALRSGIPMNDVVTQLRGISCDRAVGIGPNKVLSMPDAIGQILQTHMMEKEGIQEDLGLGGTAAPQMPAAQTVAPEPQAQLSAQPKPAPKVYNPGEHFIGTCPECSSDLQFAEGCVKCLSCGYSECG